MGSVDWLYDLRPVEFDWKTKNLAGEYAHSYGLIAEEVEEIRPEITAPDESGKVDAVSYSKLIPHLLKSVQDLNAKIKVLENA